MNVSLRPLAFTDVDNVEVTSAGLSIGRGDDCDLQLQNLMVSRRHAELLVSDDGVLVRDLESRNGTFVNGEPVQTVRRLRDGDVVAFAIVPFEIQINRHAKYRISRLSRNQLASIANGNASAGIDGPTDRPT